MMTIKMGRSLSEQSFVLRHLLPDQKAKIMIEKRKVKQWSQTMQAQPTAHPVLRPHQLERHARTIKTLCKVQVKPGVKPRNGSQLRCSLGVSHEDHGTGGRNGPAAVTLQNPVRSCGV